MPTASTRNRSHAARSGVAEFSNARELMHRRGRQPTMKRRNFLRGAAGVSIALPFLEGLPQRSAWAMDTKPIFSFFVSAVHGCVPERFFPESTGPLDEAALAASGKATSQLARHAGNLLLLSGINWPSSARNDAHTQGMCQVLTARAPDGGGSTSTSTGPSADVVIASLLHPELAPINLHAGNLRNGYASARLSFVAAGQLSPVIDNPYTLYRELVGLTGPDGETPEGRAAAELLLAIASGLSSTLTTASRVTAPPATMRLQRRPMRKSTWCACRHWPPVWTISWFVSWWIRAS